MFNSNFTKLYIKRRTPVQWMAFAVFILPFSFAFLFQFLGMPNFIKYSIDVLLILIIGLFLIERRLIFKKKSIIFVGFLLLFLLYSFIVYLFTFQSPFYFLWGVRNNFRYYIAFLAFALFLTQDDIQTLLKFFDIIFWINIPIVFIQYFYLGYTQDYLGGIFGVNQGCNGYMIIFFSIMVAKSLLMFMNKQEKTLNCFSKCALTLFISALAEMKVFFVLFILILIMTSIFTSFSFRKFIIIFAGAVLTMVFSSLLVELFGFEGFLSLEKILEQATKVNYSDAKDLNRFTAIPTLSNSILNEWYERIFGLGLGNCDTSSFAICNTPFYASYNYLHYTWISSAFLFLETGYIGLTLFIIFFIVCFIMAFYYLKKGIGNKLFNQMAIIMAFLSILLTFYDSSLRTEAGYMVYFILALPFVELKNNSDNQLRFFSRKRINIF